MHTVYHQGAGAGGKPTRSQPLAAPSLSQTYHSYTPRRSRHTWAACCTVRLTVSHMKKKEEAGICWTGDVECGEGGGDMLEMDAECGEGGGWAGM